MDDLRDLPLREYRPRSRLVVPEHPVTVPRFPVVDAHNHLGRWLTPDGDWAAPDVGALLSTMDSRGVRSVVNLDGRWGAELEANLDRYDRAHPGRFATFCHVDWSELAVPGFGPRLAASLRASVRAGAAGLKVWKDLGLHRRDHTGALVLPDDPRLAPLWEAAGELAVPVYVHTADPVAFFDPLDATNERLEQLLEHPDWVFSGPEFPPFARLMEALEGLVAAHPGTIFVAVHAGCWPENLGWVDRMLAAYPHLWIDIAARLAELGRQPRATRALVLKHAGRVLFGTDEFPPDPDVYALHYRFLETADEHFPHSEDDIPLMGRWAVSGIHLPDPVLRAVYAGNATRLLPALRR
jgi:predicted TIM-barrel fold metal-dependent hydrolase